MGGDEAISSGQEDFLDAKRHIDIYFLVLNKFVAIFLLILAYL